MKPRRGDSNWWAALSGLMLWSPYPRESLSVTLDVQIQISYVIAQLRAQRGHCGELLKALPARSWAQMSWMQPHEATRAMLCSEAITHRLISVVKSVFTRQAMHFQNELPSYCWFCITVYNCHWQPDATIKVKFEYANLTIFFFGILHSS